MTLSDDLNCDGKFPQPVIMKSDAQDFIDRVKKRYEKICKIEKLNYNILVSVIDQEAGESFR